MLERRILAPSPGTTLDKDPAGKVLVVGQERSALADNSAGGLCGTSSCGTTFPATRPGTHRRVEVPMGAPANKKGGKLWADKQGEDRSRTKDFQTFSSECFYDKLSQHCEDNSLWKNVGHMIIH